MPAFKHISPYVLGVFAALMLGAAPPVPECDAPSMLLGPCPAIRWEPSVSRTEPHTMLWNHVFAVPTPAGRLLAGSDPDFLIYPPDCSPGSTHLGPVRVEPGLPVTHRAVEWPSVLSTHGEWGLVSFVCDGYSRLSPLMLGYRWDALCPGSAIGVLLGVPEGGPTVHFLFSGEVGPGCKLSSPRPTEPAAEAPDADPALLPVYSSVDDFIDYQRRLTERLSRNAESIFGCGPYYF